jgi:RNA polymerase sigma-70 factor (ECF subfamily)
VSVLPLDRQATRQSAAWSPQDDVPLVQSAQVGSTDSFDALYRRHARVVHAVLLGRATREDVEDLVQEVFLTAWRQLSTLRDPAAFGGWVVTIARRQRIDHARRQRAGTPEHGNAGTQDVRRTGTQEPRSPDAPPDDRLEAKRVLETIRALPAAYRETLVLRLVEGMTGPEIAARTGLTADSVRVNLCRGMKLLREALDGAASARAR